MGSLRISASASQWLDLSRGLAAIAVLLGHGRSLFFVDFARVQQPTVLTKVLYLLTTLGHQAVVIFFVLSGFLISGSVLRSLREGRWSWRDYLLHRIVRLWVVLIPALFLGAFWDILGIRLFGADPVYLGLWAEDQGILFGYSTVEGLNAPSFVGNVFFLQTIVFRQFGSNAALWSLSWEFWYYMIFPCLLLSRAGSSWSVRCCHVVAVIAMAVLLPPKLMIYFGFWLLGVLARVVPEICWGRSRPFVIGVFGMIFALSLLAPRVIAHELLGSLCVAIGFAALLVPIVSAPGSPHLQGKASLLSRFATQISGFSYTLYLVHLPPLVFLHTWLYSHEGTKWQPDVRHLSLAALIAVGVLAYAWTISRVTEARTSRIRVRVERFLAWCGIMPKTLCVLP